MSPTSNVLPDESASEDYFCRVRQLRLWQGTVISAAALAKMADTSQAPLWVISSQACNIYNSSLTKVPVIELVAADYLSQQDTLKYRKGDHPRLLHTYANCQDKLVALELDNLKRIWVQRSSFAHIDAVFGHIEDQGDGSSEAGYYLDEFIGWMARSYTRIALPDRFNEILKDSKIKEVLEKKLIKDHAEIFGIYLTLTRDNEIEWQGRLGDMPAPYDLGLMIVTNSGYDPDIYAGQLKLALFETLVPDSEGVKRTRAEIAKQAGLRIVPAGIEGRPVDDLTVPEAKAMLRYSMVDHLSFSSIADL